METMLQLHTMDFNRSGQPGESPGNTKVTPKEACYVRRKILLS